MAVVSLDDAAERAIAEVRSRVTGSWMNHHHENKQRLEAALQPQRTIKYDNPDK
jgi:NADPH-dependent ferric siderophore reductase